MSDDLVFAPATELAEQIRSKSVSPTEVMQAHLSRIESVNPKLNAIVTPDETAMDQAREAEDALMRGELRGPLHGVPFTAKDSVDVGGLRTTRGSRFFEDHVPDADAVVITRLKDAGAVFLGHTNVPEFVFWFETDNAVFGRTENPWKLGRTTGGSSGGEAAALSAGDVPVGTGQRRRVLDPSAGGVLRRRGTEADARARAADGTLARRPAALHARRADGAHGQRRGRCAVPALRAGRPRPLRHASAGTGVRQGWTGRYAGSGSAGAPRGLSLRSPGRSRPPWQGRRPHWRRWAARWSRSP